MRFAKACKAKGGLSAALEIVDGRVKPGHDV